MAGVLGLILLVPWCVTRGGGDAGTDEAIAEVTPATCASATADLPLRARLAMTLMIGVDGDAPADAVALLDSATRPGGLFVRGGSAIWDDQSLAEPRGDGLPLLVAVDDEGGVGAADGGGAGRAAQRGVPRRGVTRGADVAGGRSGRRAAGTGDQHGVRARPRRGERRRDRGPLLRRDLRRGHLQGGGLRRRSAVSGGAAGAEALPRAGARRCGHPREPVDHTVAGAAPQQRPGAVRRHPRGRAQRGHGGPPRRARPHRSRGAGVALARRRSACCAPATSSTG